MKNIASPGFDPTPVQSEPSTCTTGVMTTSDIYVIKGHIQTKRQNFFFRKLRDILRDTCLLGALGISRMAKFSPGEIIPCEIVPGRNPPPPPVGDPLSWSLLCWGLGGPSFPSALSGGRRESNPGPLECMPLTTELREWPNQSCAPLYATKDFGNHWHFCCPQPPPPPKGLCGTRGSAGESASTTKGPVMY